MTLAGWWRRAMRGVGRSFARLPALAGRLAAPVRRLAAPARRLRAPAMPQLSRARAHLAMAVLGVLAMTIGAGYAALARPPVASPIALTTLGPVSIHLPDDVGPWTVVAAADLERLRASEALGGAEIEGVWGAVAPGTVVVTVFTATPRSPGAAVDALAAVPVAGDATWSGRAPHAVGAAHLNGLRELMLAMAVTDDLLVIVSMCGPEAAFASGTLDEAFRAVTVDEAWRVVSVT